MSKYVEPPKKPEVSAMDKLTNAAKDAGNSLVNAVEEACQAAYDSVVNTINEMVNTAVKTATGMYDAAKNAITGAVDTVEGMYNQAEQTVKNFADSVEEAYDDIMADEDAYTSGEYQGTMLTKANDATSNLSPKQLKELSETPSMVDNLSKDLASAGQLDLKTKILG